VFRGSLLIATIAALALMVTGAQAAPGNLDAQWGSGGAVFTNFGGTDDTAYGVAVQSDGNVVAAGKQEGTTDNIALARYQSKNGALDGNCAQKGKVTASFTSTSDETARGVIARPAGNGGQIAVAGWTDANGVDDDFAVMQFTKSCALDKNWNKSGMTRTDFGGNDHGRALAVRSDGKLIVVGVTDVDDPGDTALARYLTSGKLDTSWGTDGRIVYDQSDGGSYDDAVAVLIQPDGKIVTAGSGFTGGGFDMIVSRFNSDGTPDLSFGNGTNGQQFVDFGGQDAAFAVALYGSDIVVGGSSDGDGAVARLSGVDGSVDWTDTEDFGGSDDQINGIGVHNGFIVAAGATNESGDYNYIMARWDGGSTLDPGFGGTGIVETDFGGDEGARALAIKNGKAIAAGDNTAKGTDDFITARYSL
jgi:uncharacterized delta-60 repeat protein